MGNAETFGVLLLVAFLLTMGLEAFVLFKNRTFGEQYRLHIHRHSSLVGLNKAGFLTMPDSSEDSNVNAVRLNGKVNEYTVEVYFEHKVEWFAVPEYIVRVFFDLDGLSTADLEIILAKNLSRSNFFRWENGVKLMPTYGEKRISIGKFSHPNTQQLIADAHTISTELKKLGLKPIGHIKGTDQ